MNIFLVITTVNPWVRQGSQNTKIEWWHISANTYRFCLCCGIVKSKQCFHRCFPVVSSSCISRGFLHSWSLHECRSLELKFLYQHTFRQVFSLVSVHWLLSVLFKKALWLSCTLFLLCWMLWLCSFIKLFDVGFIAYMIHKALASAITWALNIWIYLDLFHLIPITLGGREWELPKTHSCSWKGASQAYFLEAMVLSVTTELDNWSEILERQKWTNFIFLFQI